MSVDIYPECGPQWVEVLPAVWLAAAADRTIYVGPQQGGMAGFTGKGHPRADARHHGRLGDAWKLAWPAPPVVAKANDEWVRSSQQAPECARAGADP